MAKFSKYIEQQNKLNNKYKQLIEEAYNLRQTDHALSDISEYKAIQLLHKINRLRYLNRETQPPVSLS
ncbi:MAG: Lacal_2735 family protein [Flavobacteriaceae bacterium]|nr:Lacal_2735 family protein [Flavobacteriaceae bacterium]